MLSTVGYNDQVKDLPAHVASGSRKKFRRVVELCGVDWWKKWGCSGWK